MVEIIMLELGLLCALSFVWLVTKARKKINKQALEIVALLVDKKALKAENKALEDGAVAIIEKKLEKKRKNHIYYLRSKARKEAENDGNS